VLYGHYLIKKDITIVDELYNSIYVLDVVDPELPSYSLPRSPLHNTCLVEQRLMVAYFLIDSMNGSYT